MVDGRWPLIACWLSTGPYHTALIYDTLCAEHTNTSIFVGVLPADVACFLCPWGQHNKCQAPRAESSQAETELNQSESSQVGAAKGNKP